jgi:large subunit ribosomal protein L34e
MVRRSLRAGSVRKVAVKTPGGRVVIHREKRNPKPAHCANCGSVLKGVPKLRPVRMTNLAKTKKRPERPYGGILCSSCSRAIFKEKAKSLG